MELSESSDDATIPDSAALWRRIHPDWVRNDAESGEPRPSTQAFQDHGPAMSVYIADLSIEAEVMRGFDGYSLAAITAELARSCQLRIERVPLPDFPGHAHVIGRKTGLVRSTLSKNATWVRRPST